MHMKEFKKRFANDFKPSFDALSAEDRTKFKEMFNALLEDQPELGDLLEDGDGTSWMMEWSEFADDEKEKFFNKLKEENILEIKGE